MALRTFTDQDGQKWNAWQVHPSGAGVGFAERYRDGWVCFELVGGGSRCRIPLDQLPSWETLPDSRLALARRLADATSSTTASARLPDDIARFKDDDAHGRPSGPLKVIGGERTRE